MSIRQTRRGWCQELLLGCEAKDEFKWFETTNGQNTQYGTSLEDSNCLMRICCSGCHEFSMTVKEVDTENEIFSVHRPMRLLPGCAKCCCYQEMTISAKDEKLGKVEELCWYCVPRMLITDQDSQPLYKLHSPTCCMGMCVNCCAEGNPCCGRGCCKVPFHIFPATQMDTDNGAPEIGKIVKVPKSIAVELFTDAEAYDITFPEDATPEQKAIIAGTTIFLNANFFENESNENAEGGVLGDVLSAGLNAGGAL